MPGVIKEKNNSSKKFDSDLLKNIALSTFIGVLITAILSAVVSVIMYSTKTDFTLYYYLIYLFIFSGALFNARFLYRRVKGRGIIIGSLSSLPYMAVMLVIFLIVLQFNVSVNVLLIPLVSFGGGIVGGITAANSRR